MKTVVGLPWREVKDGLYENIDDFMVRQRLITPNIDAYFVGGLDSLIIGFESSGNTEELTALFSDRFVQQARVYILG